jgi:uncharacterized protein
VHVSHLFHYPVKSLRGVAVEVLTLGARGPLHDREWMLVDPQGRFLSQRSTPLMATLTASVTSDTLRLGDDDGTTLEVPRETDGASADVTIWRDTVPAVDCGDAAAAWLEARLHQPCRLVRMPASTTRPLDPKFSPRPDAQTGFSDAYPVLLTTTASLAALNRELRRPLGMERFRPNVVITGAPEWAEDEWRVVQAGAVTFDLVKPCARCAVITTDQRSGEKPDGSTPLTVLAASRTLPAFGAIFGQNAVHRADGTLRLGDPLSVLEKQPRPAFVPR